MSWKLIIYLIKRPNINRTNGHLVTPKKKIRCTVTILAKKIFRLSILVYLLTNEMNIILFQINMYFVSLFLDLMTACIHQGSDSQSFWKYSGVIALQTYFEIRNLLFFLLWVTITFKRLDQFCCAKRRKDAF